ncbi:MAG TPA: hypothetical protein PKH39_14790 [Woeseiaceae bacterium]|nr:hypothetical protein [Woeseiaceae bacterium]
MTAIRIRTVVLAVASLGVLTSCGGAKVNETCDEVRAYQLVVPGKRIVVPDGLDPLDEFKEMPIPKAETPPRPAGSRCIESPPSILVGGAKDNSE